MTNVYGTYYSDYLYGDQYGYAENDSFYSYSGNDWIDAKGGNDYIDAYGDPSYDYDTVTGGTGADTYAIADASGYTQYAADGWSSYGYSDGYLTVTDYNYWEGDTIQLGYSDYVNGYYSSNNSYDYNGNGYADTSIYYGNNLVSIVADTSYVNYSFV